MTTLFSIPIRVYYEDTDAQGVVYYANYLKYFERARTEWLREFSPAGKLAVNENLIFMVRRVEVDYLHSARLDDLLRVSLKLSEKTRVRFILRQQIFRDRKLICDAMIKMICLNASTFKPVRIPDSINSLYKSTLK